MLGWALNEEENIGTYIDRAGAVLAEISDDHELIIIDDGSTDTTWNVMTEMQTTRPWLRLHRNGRNRGPGFNTKQAIALARKDFLFWQTVDWSYDITELMRSLHLLREFDVLQGVRLGTLSAPGMLTRRSDNAWKGFVSVTNYRLVRFLFRLPFHDFQNVTVYPRRLIQSVRLETESPFTNPECLLKTWWKGATFKEIPVPFIKRQLGQAKGTRLKFLYASVRDILYWWIQWIVLGNREDRGRGKVTGVKD
jgi:dolichol-phosphate mannosyltransferase